MTRIPLRTLDQMTEQAREMTVTRGNLNVYRALANAPKVFTGWMTAGQAALSSTVLPARLRELVILRTAHLMESPYEVAQHTTTAAASGVTDDEIAALAEDDLGSVFRDQTERTVLELTTMLVASASVDAELLKDVYLALGREATVEVLMIINRWAGLALMLNALDVDIDPTARLTDPRHRNHDPAQGTPL